MPKLKLEYDLETERNAAEIAVKSLDYAIAWHELREWLRDKIRYQNRNELIIVRETMAQIETERELPEVE